MTQLKTHQNQFQSCTKCSIASKHKVFFRGKLPCVYLFIGEAPGPSETVLHKPFVGTSGKILDQLFRDTGMCERSFGLTNVLSCFPYQEDQPRAFRPPTFDEAENCRERLDELVELASASYYISLGATAKKYPPTGCTFHLHLDHPSFIARKGGEGSLVYRRNKHTLLKFMKETDED